MRIRCEVIDALHHGDSLFMGLIYEAEVSTSRLVLTNPDITHDVDGDGDRESAVSVQTYQKGKD